MQFTTLTNIKDNPLLSNQYQAGDVLVLFGELFSRGYANGLVEQAQERGMTIIRSTVGRRDEQQRLRPLTAEEAQSIPKPFINVPLECGFDLQASNTGPSPVELCKGISLKEGIRGQLNLEAVRESQVLGRERFRQQVRDWCSELETHLPPGKKVLIAHLMAGGVPRSKIVLSLLNRVFKGTGDRYLNSEEFWNSDIGQLCQMSFQEVTAESFNILIEETNALRERQTQSGGSVHYSAYGYHGTPIYHRRQVEWFSYTPYLQGFAKIKLEEYARHHWQQGVPCTVYNCPEILTNSSSIFPGVEIFLYSLLFECRARDIKHPFVKSLLLKAEESLVPDAKEKIRTLIDNYFDHPVFRKSLQFEKWPSHSNKELMELMLSVSDELIQAHKDPNVLMTSFLSEVVIRASGALMLRDLSVPNQPVAWIGHDAIINYFETTGG